LYILEKVKRKRGKREEEEKKRNTLFFHSKMGREHRRGCR